MMKSLAIVQPLLSSYWFYADLQLITNEVDVEHIYFLTNFIDLHSSGGSLFELYFSYELIHYQMQMFIYCPFLKSWIVDKKKTPISINFIKEAIDEGWYVLNYVNRSFFPEHNMGSGDHQIMIYGYDDSLRRLYFCDHNAYGKFQTELSCSYEAYADGYLSVDQSVFMAEGSDFLCNAFLFQAQPCQAYHLDIFSVIRSLRIYLNLEQSEYEKNAFEGNYFGLQIYDHMAQYFAGLSNGISVFSTHMGSYAVLYDHKIILLELLKKLCRMGLIEPEFPKQYRVVAEKTLSLRNRMLKYIMSKNSALIPQLLRSTNEIKELERQLLLSVVNKLEQNKARKGTELKALHAEVDV